MSNPTTITAPDGAPFLDVEREFDAPRELVFRAWTDPELVVRWLGPRRLTMRVDEWDARTGGAYRYVHTDEDGTEYGFRGAFHTVREPELIVQTFEFDGVPDDVSLESMRFVDADGRTRVVQHAVFSSVETRDAAMQSGMTDGIEEAMQRLDEMIAAGALR